MQFHYVEWAGRFYPYIRITLHGPADNLESLALLDSGATVSLFHARVADVLGLTLQSGEQLTLGGAAGGFPGYRHLVPVTVGQEELEIAIVFSEYFAGSMDIIGRQDFFEHFLITFDERARLITLEPH